MKWADVQQIASRASCSTNVISLSLVIISRSVGWEIQIRLPEGCKRKNSWTRYKTLPTAHVEDVLTTIRTCMLGESQKLSNRKWSHRSAGDTVTTPQQRLLGCLELESYSVENSFCAPDAPLLSQLWKTFPSLLMFLFFFCRCHGVKDFCPVVSPMVIYCICVGQLWQCIVLQPVTTLSPS